MPRRILYLGLNPPPHVLHYPVITTQKLETPAISQALALWPHFTHVLFTSKTTVRYWFEIKPDFDKIALAIGPSTAAELLLRGITPLIAPVPTQEGLLALTRTLSNPYFFFPRSRKARPLLTDSLQDPFFALDLYDTLFQRPEPLPNFAEIDEIIFTSPSTVQGFLRIFGKLPRDKILTPIGPVTEEALRTHT